jgi:hypothetical protein
MTTITFDTIEEMCFGNNSTRLQIHVQNVTHQTQVILY